MKFLMGLILGFILLPVILGIYLTSGYAPAAATDSPLPFEAKLAHGSLNKRIAREAPDKQLSTFTTADLVNGALVYQVNCSFCHGLPGQPATSASKGMYPHAPQLFTADGTVTDDPVGVSYWKVKNGIRLTGMPSFRAALGDQQMWQVSALVASAAKLPPEVLDALHPEPIASAPASFLPGSSSPLATPANQPAFPAPPANPASPSPTTKPN
ncbi:MAG: cytochrome c [Candidatus Acidiferrales bacterium]